MSWSHALQHTPLILPLKPLPRKPARSSSLLSMNCPSSCLCMKVAQSCLTLCNPIDYTGHGILQARILEWVAIPFSRGFPTQGLNPGLPHCRQMLYHLSHQGSPTILAWVAYLFSRRSSWPRNRTRAFCTAGGFFTRWATRIAHIFSCLAPLHHNQLSVDWLCWARVSRPQFNSVKSGRCY